MSSPRLSILAHPHQRTTTPFYLVDHMARIWEKQGWTVTHHYGVGASTQRAIKHADLVILHVDLSVVPAAYRALVEAHPNVINRDILDISKGKLSRNRVRPGDDYNGPVIIKTSLNSAGWAEYRASHAWPRRAWNRLRKTHRYIGWPASLKPDGSGKYAVLNHRDEVPAEVWGDAHWVVERFRPERLGEAFVLREWYFFKDRDYWNCEVSSDALITSGELRPDMAAPPPADLQELRRQLGMELGKFDYAIDENGETVLFDINKTPTMRRPPSAIGRAVIEKLAQGLRK